MGEARSDVVLLAALRAGEESAFVELVGRYHPRLVRLARAFVSRTEVAEDVVQETWLALLTGLDRFEGRSSLRTWLFQVCVNRARSTGLREHRTVPIDPVDLTGPVVEHEQFTHAGAWTSPPQPWPDVESRAEDDARMVAAIRRAIDELPALQGLVVTMRDIDGLAAQEVCAILSISAANQRVLLHRGRTTIRDVVTWAVIDS